MQKINWGQIMFISYQYLNINPKDFWDLTFLELLELIKYNSLNNKNISHEDIEKLKNMIRNQLEF